MNPFRKITDRLILTWRLMRDPRVPLWTKVIPVLLLAYVLSPLDLIPDLILGLGQIDDVGILLAGLRFFEAVAPPNVVAEHQAAVKSRHTRPEVVDAPGYRVVKDKPPQSTKSGKG